jgi:NDP-sugar pyrophosphorylase family protein
VRAFRTDARFWDIGTSGDYLSAALALAGADTRALIDPSSDIAADARLEQTVVWGGARVGAGATLWRSIVTSGAEIPSGFVARGQIIEPSGTGGGSEPPIQLTAIVERGHRS